MAEIQPLRALHYAAPDQLHQLVAPPYDVIDDALRADLAGRSPHNVVHVDLPANADYDGAAAIFRGWQDDGAVVRDDEPAIWALRQDYTGPDGRALTRHGFFARVRVTEYGPGRIRPHERTHPGPKEDRLRLTRATRANLSPIFSLFSDPDGRAAAALGPHVEGAPWGEITDDEGTRHALWRVSDGDAIAAVQAAIADAELLIADGHHRYETARVYADEIGGEGAHRYVLMCLVALQDPGLTVFPTHRLVKETTPEQQEALAGVLRAEFDVEPAEELSAPETDGPLAMGYIDSHSRKPVHVTLRDQATADDALAGRPEPYRRLDTAVLESLLLKGPLELTDDDISHLHRFGYARTAADARRLVEAGDFDLAFVLRPPPAEQVREVAEAGEVMPPKSTYFFPKLLTGLLFNPLDDALDE
ncbi:MAG TPA: DUF1015 domain-containing protein [Solirubrobacteraceae bacterium]|jgi:uncharacterized protein (DUF1015 family)